MIFLMTNQSGPNFGHVKFSLTKGNERVHLEDNGSLQNKIVKPISCERELVHALLFLPCGNQLLVVTLNKSSFSTSVIGKFRGQNFTRSRSAIQCNFDREKIKI